jgi:PIN domain nuclease of toxin-antitoxin system
MRLLLDTHAFVLAFAAPEKLGKRVHEVLMDPGVERWVSAASFWEIATKVKIGKLELPEDEAFYRARLADLDARTLPISFAHSMTLFQLPQFHTDPFDRMLIAQGITEGLTIGTKDRLFKRYDVPIIW